MENLNRTTRYRPKVNVADSRMTNLEAKRRDLASKLPQCAYYRDPKRKPWVMTYNKSHLSKPSVFSTCPAHPGKYDSSARTVLDILSGGHLVIACVTTTLNQAFLSLVCNVFDTIDYYHTSNLYYIYSKSQISIPVLDIYPDGKKRHLNPKHRVHNLQTNKHQRPNPLACHNGGKATTA